MANSDLLKLLTRLHGHLWTKQLAVEEAMIRFFSVYKHGEI